MIVLNTVSPKNSVITGAGMNKKDLKTEIKNMTFQGHITSPIVDKMARINLGEKRKPIKFL